MSPLPPDPYKILGVSKDAQVSEIRSAHRKLVLKCHPDKVQDPRLKAEKQDEFQKVQQAYELLSDEQERRKYDDQVKLVELRKQFQGKANISTPRSSPNNYSVYTAEPPQPPGRSPPPPVSKMHAYSRSWEDEIGRGPRMFDAGAPRSSRREASYSDGPSKREIEREREKERDLRDRDKERDRRRKAEDARRAEKDAKEQRRAEKKQREKQRHKEIKREADEKKRYADPYIESFDDEPPPSKPDKKKSSSKKYEERRDSLGREDGSPIAAMPPQSPNQPRPYYTAMEFAASYISRAKNSGVPTLQRSKTYHARNVQAQAPTPPAPTPPPVAGKSSPFAVPESSARPRRGSGDGPRLAKERSYRASSRERTDDPVAVNGSPGRHMAQSQKPSPSASPVMPSPPPRRDLPRTSSMPVDSGSGRPVLPSMTRAHTFTAFGEGAPRGRERSRMHSQIEEESDSDDVYDRRARDHNKHHSSRRHRTPEDSLPGNVSRYHVDGGRAKLQSRYSGRLETETDPFRYYSTSGGIPVMESRPPMPSREGSYSAPGMKFSNVKRSKAYGYDDVRYSNYSDRPCREGHTAYA